MTWSAATSAVDMPALAQLLIAKTMRQQKLSQRDAFAFLWHSPNRAQHSLQLQLMPDQCNRCMTTVSDAFQLWVSTAVHICGLSSLVLLVLPPQILSTQQMATMHKEPLGFGQTLHRACF